MEEVMPKYKINVEKCETVDKNGFDEWKDIYTQVVTELDVKAVIDAVNSGIK